MNAPMNSDTAVAAATQPSAGAPAGVLAALARAAREAREIALRNGQQPVVRQQVAEPMPIPYLRPKA
jgi:hypothetical protein